MNDKMTRFLTSINLENIDRFDMDFDLVARNQYNREQVDMLIVKDTPWDFELFEEFEDALQTIKYPYSMKFSYIHKPIASDATKMFGDWHYRHNHFNSNLKLVGINKTITVYYDDEEQKSKNASTIKDFKEFLDFIGYNFEIVEKIAEKTPENPGISESKEEVKKEISKDEESAINAFKSTISEMRHDMERNSRSQSWKDKIPYKKIENISDITEDSANVDIEGQLYGIDKPKIIRSGLTMLLAGIGKGADAISIKILENEHMSSDFIESLKNGMWVRVLGYVSKDSFKGNLTIDVRALTETEGPELRKDDEENKRVEMHVHTKMSAMDGVTSIEDYIKLAKSMGHKAIGVTDHGVVQSYPNAQSAGIKAGIKVLYGCEFYMVNDELPFALNPVDIPLNKATYVVFDLETTGLSTRYDAITEFGGIRFENGQIVKTLDLLINPGRPIPQKIIEKTHITNEMVADKPHIEDVIDQILEFMDGAIIVSHNITFDYGFLKEVMKRLGRGEFIKPAIDTLSLSRYMFPDATAHRLGNLSKHLGMDIYDDESAHRADYDARILNDVWLAMLARLTKGNEGLKHSDLAKIKTTNAMLKHMRPSHITTFAKNEKGVQSIFKLVSLSHVNYLADVPKTPKREIEALRENLLLGSACQNSDVFEIEMTRSREDLLEAMSFYDFIEVQPPENYINLVNRGVIDSIDRVKAYITDIVECADELGKPVIATGDVHYANPEDKISRDIYIAAKAVGGKFHPLHMRDPHIENPNQHFRTTREMLDAFEFLGKEKAFEIVVTNSNKMADMMDAMAPIHTELCKPEIPDSDKMLTKACFDKAHELYGENIPQDIVDRLNRELEGINGNGYSVTYYIAHEIIKRANENGYMVGSRGSVGSSLDKLLDEVDKLMKENGFSTKAHSGYPAWEHKVDSKFREIIKDTCEEIGAPCKFEGIHAGLECGVFYEANPKLDIVSFGPDIFDIHTPAEKMSLSSFERSYNFVRTLVQKIR